MPRETLHRIRTALLGTPYNRALSRDGGATPAPGTLEKKPNTARAAPTKEDRLSRLEVGPEVRLSPPRRLRQILSTRSIVEVAIRPLKCLTEQAESALGEAGKARCLAAVLL